MDRMLAAVEILRRREGFAGYVHLKMLPGAERGSGAWRRRGWPIASRSTWRAQRRRGARPRVREGLLGRSPAEARAGRPALARGAPRGPAGHAAPAGTTTQFVVGAQGERDREILGLVGRSRAAGLLHHAHFSAFQPVAGTPMEGLPPTPAARECSPLPGRAPAPPVRLPVGGARLRRRRQPGARAGSEDGLGLAHAERFPVEPGRAPYELLLRVPGIGPTAARRLVTERRRHGAAGAQDLRRLGVDAARAGYFLTLRGRRLRAALPRRAAPALPARRASPAGAWKTAVPPCAYR